MITDDIANVLRMQPVPLGGRAVAELAGLPYKVVIDALGRMLDVGTVVRFGRKYSAEWALAGSAAGAPCEALTLLEAAWRGARRQAPPTPTGGEGRSAPPAHG